MKRKSASEGAITEMNWRLKLMDCRGEPLNLRVTSAATSTSARATVVSDWRATRFQR